EGAGREPDRQGRPGEPGAVEQGADVPVHAALAEQADPVHAVPDVGDAQAVVQLLDIRVIHSSSFLALPASPGAGHHPVARYLTSTYSRSPSREPSRPTPDCLTPPKGAAGSETRPRFRPTIPARSRPLSRRPAARSPV